MFAHMPEGNFDVTSLLDCDKMAQRMIHNPAFDEAQYEAAYFDEFGERVYPPSIERLRYDIGPSGNIIWVPELIPAT